MNKKYKNKYRIDSVRLKNWDYRNNGAYFITINTANRTHFFGEVKNNEMQLSEIGKIAENFWIEIPKHFPFVELGNFVVMPNHVHGILIINNHKTDQKNESLQSKESLQSYDYITESELKENQYYSDISPKSGSISTIIRSFKSIVTKKARFINLNFNWQPKFYDVIIRNEVSFENIQNYIDKNPENWKEDKFFI